MLMRELEDLMRQMEEKDAEDQKMLKKTRRAETIEKQRMVQEAIQATEAKHKEHWQALARLFVCMQHVMGRVPSSVVSQEQRQALYALHEGLTGTQVVASLDVDGMIEVTADALASFSLSSQQEEGRSMQEILQLMLDHVKAPAPEDMHFTVQEEQDEKEVVMEQQEQQHVNMGMPVMMHHQVPMPFGLTFGSFEPPVATAAPTMPPVHDVYHDSAVIAASVQSSTSVPAEVPTAMPTQEPIQQQEEEKPTSKDATTKEGKPHQRGRRSFRGQHRGGRGGGRGRVGRGGRSSGGEGQQQK